MRINSIQTTNISYKGLNLFSKIRALISHQSKDTFVKTTEIKTEEIKYSTPAVVKNSIEENEEAMN